MVLRDMTEPWPTVKGSRDLWLAYRELWGRKSATPLFTPPDHQPKTSKNNLPTYLLHLAPANAVGIWNLCPWATPNCKRACLNTAGRGRYENTQKARHIKSLFLGDYPAQFITLLNHEIALATKRHGQIAIRLNGTSDLLWERFAPQLFTDWNQHIFYDYTKSPSRSVLPDNYHLTYSVNERDDFEKVQNMINRSNYGRAAIVFDTPRSQKLPLWWGGIPVVDGDTDDQRWLDYRCIIGLRAKGRAIGDTSGFVRRGITTVTPDEQRSVDWRPQPKTSKAC
jgi:hypothetical protein